MTPTLAALTFLSAIGGFLFGYDTGVVSGAMLLIEDDPDINPNTTWKELIVTSTVGPKTTLQSCVSLGNEVSKIDIGAVLF